VDLVRTAATDAHTKYTVANEPLSGTYICSCVSRYFASTCSSLSSVSPAPLVPNLPPTPGVSAPNHVQEAGCEVKDKHKQAQTQHTIGAERKSVPYSYMPAQHPHYSPCY
jgi:hypothetical protein